MTTCQSLDSETVVTGGVDKFVRVWSVAKRKQTVSHSNPRCKSVHRRERESPESYAAPSLLQLSSSRELGVERECSQSYDTPSLLNFTHLAPVRTPCAAVSGVQDGCTEMLVGRDSGERGDRARGTCAFSYLRTHTDFPPTPIRKLARRLHRQMHQCLLPRCYAQTRWCAAKLDKPRLAMTRAIMTRALMTRAHPQSRRPTSRRAPRATVCGKAVRAGWGRHCDKS